MKTPQNQSLAYMFMLIGSYALLSACCSMAPKIDAKPGYDFSSVRTIAFYYPPAKGSAAAMQKLDQEHYNAIVDALSKTLEDKGYTLVEEPHLADILLSWHLVLEPQSAAYNDGFSGSDHAYSAYDRYSGFRCWSCASYFNGEHAFDYKPGYFIVDLIDPHSTQSVWRSVNASRLDQRLFSELEVEAYEYALVSQASLEGLPDSLSGPITAE